MVIVAPLRSHTSSLELCITPISYTVMVKPFHHHKLSVSAPGNISNTPWLQSQPCDLRHPSYQLRSQPAWLSSPLQFPFSQLQLPCCYFKLMVSSSPWSNTHCDITIHSNNHIFNFTLDYTLSTQYHTPHTHVRSYNVTYFTLMTHIRHHRASQSSDNCLLMNISRNRVWSSEVGEM